MLMAVCRCFVLIADRCMMLLVVLTCRMVFVVCGMWFCLCCLLLSIVAPCWLLFICCRRRLSLGVACCCLSVVVVCLLLCVVCRFQSLVAIVWCFVDAARCVLSLSLLVAR